MVIYNYSNSDELHHYEKSLVICFKGKRKVLSTASYNGGYRENLVAVFNNDCKPDDGSDFNLKATTQKEHMMILAKELGLDPSVTTGLMTAADMENVSIQSESFNNTTVTAVVTGGIEVNGGRVGDPASWVEESGQYIPVTAGTINIMLSIDADLTKGAIVRSLVTCTEAKTAAIQELLAPSKYSMGIATGSGTDGSIIITNAESDVKLTNAGKHSKLGELIGRVVKTAVKEALKKQTGLSPTYQHNIFRRMDRFGVTQEILWTVYVNFGGQFDKTYFMEQLEKLAIQDKLVTFTSLYAHLIDQLMWGLISANEAIMAGAIILSTIHKQHKNVKQTEIFPTTELAIEHMVKSYNKSIIEILACDY